MDGASPARQRLVAIVHSGPVSPGTQANNAGRRGDVHAYTMTTARNVFDSVPDEVRTAFDGTPHLTMPKLAKAMRMDLKTLGQHREAQNLPVHIKGTGLERRHYVCTLKRCCRVLSPHGGSMSVFRVKNSPYYQFDFQIKGHRFYGSTESKNEREAKEVEKAKRAEAARLVTDSIATGRKPMTAAAACDRWWDQVGQHGSDPDLKRALDWLVEQLGPQVALHDVNDNSVSLAVEAGRKCVMRAGVDDNGNQLHRPVSPRTVNKTVPSLLRRVMRRARKNWSVTILKEPDWKEHFVPERRRPVR
jgi:hypothetical protein